MMKIAVLLVGSMLTFNASAQAFQNKTNVITLGLGVNPFYKNGFKSTWGNDYKYNSLGPIVLSYERGITELLGIGRIGVGGSVGQSYYFTKWYHKGYEYSDNTVRTSIFFRAAYHFDFGIDKMDVYAGVGGGVFLDNRIKSSNDPDKDVAFSGSGVASTTGEPSVFGGIRYYFTDWFGVYGEVGYQPSAVSGGLVFKF